MYEHLVIEGNGVNGIAVLGVLSELEQQGHLSSITHFAGASSGGFIATLLALGFTVEELSNFLSLETFKSLTPPCYVKQVYNLFFHNGLMSIKAARKQFEGLLASKYNVNLTLQQLYEQTGNTLVLVVTDIKDQKPLYLNRHHHPNVKVVDAAMASISVPVLYIPRQYDFGEGRRYYVDGGLTNNYPLWIFNDEEKLKTRDFTSLRSKVINDTTLGIAIYEKNLPSSKKVTSLIPYLKSVLNTLVSNTERYYVTHSFEKQSLDVYIDTGIFFGDFELNPEQWITLFELGEEAARAFLEH